MVGRFVVVVVVVVDEGKKGAFSLPPPPQPISFLYAAQPAVKKALPSRLRSSFFVSLLFKKDGGSARRPLKLFFGAAYTHSAANHPATMRRARPCFVSRFTASPRGKNSVMQEEEREKREGEESSLANSSFLLFLSLFPLLISLTTLYSTSVPSASLFLPPIPAHTPSLRQSPPGPRRGRTPAALRRRRPPRRGRAPLVSPPSTQAR